MGDGGPHAIDGCATLTALFLQRCRELGGRTAHREKTLGVWKSHSWAEFLDSARAIGLGLAALGLRRGEAVSILSEDNKEWIYADLGIQCMGGIVSGVYPTDSAEQVAFLLVHSQSRFLIVENAEQLDKFLQVRDRVPGLRRCVVLDREGLHDFADDGVLFLDELCRIGREAHARDPDRFAREAAAAHPDDTAILIYTSGTTGPPKGAMISHANIVCSASSALSVLPVREGDEQLCFLPLCHVLERLVSVFVPIAAKSVVNFAESVETVFDNLREVSPVSFTAVPRIWEKIHSSVSVMAREATPAGRWAYRRALACGMARADRLLDGRPVPAGLAVRFALWDRLVLANLRRMIGLDGARYIATGAAPISPELVKWYWAIGLVMLEGYGQTESSGVLTVNLPHRNRLGSIGPAVPDVEVKIAADGEILARGRLVFKGYWNDPALTAETVREGLAAYRRCRAGGRRRVLLDHRAAQGHHHHRRRQERQPGRDREPDKVLALCLGRHCRRRQAPVPYRPRHDRPGERGEVRAGEPGTVLRFRLALRRAAGPGPDPRRGRAGECRVGAR